MPPDPLRKAGARTDNPGVRGPFGRAAGFLDGVLPGTAVTHAVTVRNRTRRMGWPGNKAFGHLGGGVQLFPATRPEL